MTAARRPVLHRPRPAPAWLLAGLLALLGVLLALVAPPAAAAETGLFGSIEREGKRDSPFPLWADVLDRIDKEAAAANGNGGQCKTRTYNACRYDGWMAFLDSLRDAPLRTQLNRVNRFMNRKRYILDSQNWGTTDYWATPGQFLDRHGDCEDYAIAKYMSLKTLGWPTDKMRVVVLKDLNLKATHAVLAVKFEGKELILDNQIAVPVDHTRIRHYRPIYSVTEGRWWRHLPARR